MSDVHQIITTALQEHLLAGNRQLSDEQVRDAADVVTAALQEAGVLRGREAASAEDQEIYERFMREFKQVGIWQGGKPVRAKLKRLAKEGKLQQVWDGLARLQADPNRPEKGYVPRPLTWLNQERWNDDPYPPRQARGAASRVLDIRLDAPQRQVGPSIRGELDSGRW